MHGVSTRDVAEVTEALTGATVGRSSVSRVTKRLDEYVEALRKTPIVGLVPYLYLDATFLNARWARRVENVSVLVAYGVGLVGAHGNIQIDDSRRQARVHARGASLGRLLTAVKGKSAARSSYVPLDRSQLVGESLAALGVSTRASSARRARR